LGILPHAFFYIFAKTTELATIDLVEPVHSQEIGLVLSNREPPSPMVSALSAATLDAERNFAAAGAAR
jgi:hypothetical protein